MIQAFLVIGIFSFVFKYNVFYRFCESTFIGVSVGIAITMAIDSLKKNAITPIINGNYIYILAIILGFLIFPRLSRQYGYLSRISIAVMIGATMGAGIRLQMESQILGQIKPVLTQSLITGDIVLTISRIFMWVGMIGGLTYFLFATTAVPEALRKPFDILSKFGRYVILAMLGSSYANVVLGRSSMFIERIYFILQAFGIVK